MKVKKLHRGMLLLLAVGSRLHAADSRRCYAKALASAVENIDNDALDEIHKS